MKKTRKTYKFLLQLAKRDKAGQIIAIYDNEEFLPLRKGTSLLQKYIAVDKKLHYTKQKGGVRKKINYGRNSKTIKKFQNIKNHLTKKIVHLVKKI